MSSERENTLAKAVPPEDIREGDYLAVLNVVDEVLPAIEPAADWARAPKSIEPVRVVCLPCGESVPLKVAAVCLPFVLVKAPRPPAGAPFGGMPDAPATTLRTLDVRRYRLARLPEEYGKRVYRMLKGRAARKRSAAGTDDDDDDE